MAWGLTPLELGHLTSAVQLGFISGTLGISLSGLADRFSASRIFAVCAVLAALTNAAFALSDGLSGALFFRFFTGVAFAFPAGQSLAKGEEGAWPTALGHEQWVGATVPLNLGQQENLGAGHSDYWGWNTKPKPLQRATKAASEIRDYLQFASAGSRAIADRQLEECDAVEARELVAREIVKWSDYG